VCLGTQAGLCDVTGSWVSVGNVTNWPVGAALQPAATYWWQVRGVMGSTQAPADSGQAWRFVTANNALPGSFRKSGPLNGMTSLPTLANTVRLTWTQSSSATGYHVCLGTLSGPATW